jgi:hypothetical protein
MKQFSDSEYCPDHWAMKKFDLSDQTNNNLVAIFGKSGKMDKGFAFYLNPTDRRGYRSLVRFFDNDSMASTFNRNFSFEEQLVLVNCLQIVSHVYQQIVPISQVCILGNNSHSFEPNDRKVIIGTDKEPNILHGHIIGRGDPDYDYIKGIALYGPVPGESFDLINNKVKWLSHSDIEITVNHFKDVLNQSKDVIETLLNKFDYHMFV